LIADGVLAVQEFPNGERDLGGSAMRSSIETCGSMMNRRLGVTSSRISASPRQTFRRHSY
jgi:hypothetical protein